MSPDPREATLAELGEFELIKLLQPQFNQHDAVLIGPGDDAAVLRIKAGHVVVSTDLMVEGRHFRRDWADAEEIGARAAAQNLADIAAMGGKAHSLTVGLAAPGDLPVQWALDFAAGFAAEAELVGASVVGGDLTRSDAVVIAVTVLGTCDVAPVRRSGAQAGDVLALTGRIGWAAGGLAVLSRGFRSPRALVDAYRKPQPPYRCGPLAAKAGARAMIDVSDGLVADVGHIAEASEVQIRISTDRLKVPEPLISVAAAMGSDPMGFVLTGGDDHALVATFPDLAAIPPEFTVIGEVVAGSGVLVDGVPHQGEGGFTHF